jgi:hypothetical protein
MVQVDGASSGPSVDSLGSSLRKGMPFLMDERWCSLQHMQCIHLQSATGRREISCPAQVLESECQITLPMRMAREFCALTNIAARDVGWQWTHQEIWSLFFDEYIAEDGLYAYVTHEVFRPGCQAPIQLVLKVRYGGQGALLRGEGQDLLDAIVSALGWTPRTLSCQISKDSLLAPVRSVAFSEVSVQGRATFFGIGVNVSTTAATIISVLSAVNRAISLGALDDSMRSAAAHD